MAASIRRGDRVKLTEYGARINSKTYLVRAKRVDWYARRGVAVRVGKLHVYIKWDDRNSMDYEIASLIERAEE